MVPVLSYDLEWSYPTMDTVSIMYSEYLQYYGSGFNRFIQSYPVMVPAFTHVSEYFRIRFLFYI